MKYGELFTRKAGFLEVAELNNIILVFPQVRPGIFNKHGCWDWYGYSGPDFGKKNGVFT